MNQYYHAKQIGHFWSLKTCTEVSTVLLFITVTFYLSRFAQRIFHTYQLFTLTCQKITTECKLTYADHKPVGKHLEFCTKGKKSHHSRHQKTLNTEMLGPRILPYDDKHVCIRHLSSPLPSFQALPSMVQGKHKAPGAVEEAADGSTWAPGPWHPKKAPDARGRHSFPPASVCCFLFRLTFGRQDQHLLLNVQTYTGRGRKSENAPCQCSCQLPSPLFSHLALERLPRLQGKFPA